MILKTKPFKHELTRDQDPFHFGNPDPFNETDPGKQQSAKIMENVHKNQPKSQKYHIFFFAKILNFFHR